MYVVDSKDKVLPLNDLPQSSTGAPIPLLVRDENAAIVAYYTEEYDPEWDGTTVRVVGPGSRDELVALVTFRNCYAATLGPPNDEAFSGHPLADRGLEPYGSFWIENSSWLRSLEEMNRVHPHHDSRTFDRLRHYVLSFHDTTFECLAESFVVETVRSSIVEAVPRMIALLSWRDA